MIAWPFVQGLEAAQVRAVVGAAVSRRVAAHSTIYEQGRTAAEFFLLTKGRARYFSLSPDGNKMLLHWLVPGDVLGSATLLPFPSTYRVSTETLQDSSLLVWERSTIRALVERYPRLSHNALAIGVGYFDWYIAAHAALMSDTAKERLANVLAHLSSTIGTQVPGGVELRVTNEELASAANITPFTASRLLSQWQAMNAVKKLRGRIVLRSPERLFRLTA